MVLGRLKLVGVELRPWKLEEVKGRPELQNGGLRDLEEAWEDFLLEAFFCQVCSCSVAGSSQAGSRRCVAASLEVPGGQGKARAPQRWPESSGRGLGRLSA